MGKKHKKHKSDKHPYEGGSLRGWAGRGRRVPWPEADVGPRAPSGARPAPPGPAPGRFERHGLRLRGTGPGSGDGRRAWLCAGEKQLQGLEMRKQCIEEEE